MACACGLGNRTNAEVERPPAGLRLGPGEQCFNLISGREIQADRAIHARIRPRGIAAIIAAPKEALGADFDSFLARQRGIESAADFSTAFPERPTRLKPSPCTKRLDRKPNNMVEIPARQFHMKTQFRIRELGFYESTHPHFVGRGFHPLHLPIWFERDVAIRRFAIEITPVTNGQFAAFLRASGYKPRHDHNFLRHWTNGAPPAGREQHPVVWVDLEDARAYANWAGKRLPTEEEWQYSAQGDDGRVWPWGNNFDQSRCNDGASGGTTPVNAYPEGKSPFGVSDMCGNTWEWTESERSDGRTRFAIIRGGSWYDPKGSDWHMDGGPKPVNFAAKFLLMWAGLDRCATLGFRCAGDLK